MTDSIQTTIIFNVVVFSSTGVIGSAVLHFTRPEAVIPCLGGVAILGTMSTVGTILRQRIERRTEALVAQRKAMEAELKALGGYAP